MDTFITVATFNTVHESAYLKAMLESEGIECFFKDEFMVQSSWYSNAVGGMKLQIKKEDLEKALPILKEEGFLKEEVDGIPYFDKLETFTAKFPLIGKFSFLTRIFVISGALIFILALPIYYATLPGIEEQIVGKNWYLIAIDKGGQIIHPHTTGIYILYNGNSYEFFSLYKDGEIELPGVNCRRVYAKWRLENDQLLIYDADTLKNIYEGRYTVVVDDNAISLRSTNSEIRGFLQRY